MKIFYSLLLLLLLSVMFTVRAQTHTSPSVNANVFSYKNLSIYLLYSTKQIERKYITLEDALKSKKAILHETGSVNELSVDNKSNNYVFILSGDIVKGGKQDRTIGEDVILSPKDGKISLSSFCVEQSRWKRRGMENVSEFSASNLMLSNKKLKIAARSSKNQSAVWNEVSKFQTQTGVNVNKDLRSNVSATSLQLTLEDKDLQKMVKEYITALEIAFKNKENIVGFAYSINGKISTVEWFGNSDLFNKLQKKLLESAANEAVFAYMKDDDSAKRVSAKEVENLIAKAKKTNAEERNISKNTSEKKYKTENSLMFETYDTGISKDIPLHVSIYFLDDSDIEESTVPELNLNQQLQNGHYPRNIRKKSR